MVTLFTFATTVLIALPAVLAQPSSFDLHARQFTGFDPSTLPSKCLEKQCKPLVDAFTKQGCTTLDCLCTNAIATSLKDCYQCSVDANVPNFTQSIADSAVQSFVTGCNTVGKSVSVSGSSSGSGSGSNSGSSSSAGSNGGSASTSTAPASSQTGGALASTSLNAAGIIFAVALGGVALA